ncbi:hypothetical protein ES332_A09G189500v1 [Gossypium tomentosum]|uniref:glutathione transferase n=1 Tax=Gossypium tomentosum TaxID=34277 RepID=A0A5D2P5J1_GOSTO|nr:hypothetical protein ES332_A09G189500v1 [Gossypium tomentosum]
MGEEVKVFGYWASPYSYRAELALKLKGVSYEYINEDIFGNKIDLLLKYNPVHKKVPILLHNGKSIVESVVILEYIEETWKHNLYLPQDPYDKATARFWIKFIDEKNEREKVTNEACEYMKTLESALNGKKFFGGETIGMVDIVASSVGYFIRVTQEIMGLNLLSADKFPQLFQWSEDFANCSIVKESLPPRDKLLPFVKGLIAKYQQDNAKA